MRPRLAVALAAVASCATLTAPAPVAAAPQIVVPNLAGEIEAVALSGDAVVVARRPPGRTLRVERFGADGRRTELLRTRSDDEDATVRLAASPQAVGVSVADSDDDLGSSRVVVGPATGPLREVARCESALFASAVAVDGPRIAWAEGGCGDPVDRPRRSTPATLAIGAADPAVPVRRLAVREERIPIGLVLSEDRGLLGLLRPALYSFVASELQRVTPEGLGPAFGGGEGFESPVGALPDGAALLLTEAVPGFGGDEEIEGRSCDASLAVAPPTGTALRPLSLGRCPAEAAEEDGVISIGGEEVVTPAVAGGRIAALLFERTARQRARRSTPGLEPVKLATARPDGGERKVVVRGGRYRQPLLLAGGPDRLAWLQPRCRGGVEVAAADPATEASGRRIPACRADLRGRAGRVRGGATRLQLACPLGCRGRVVDRTTCRDERSRSFAFGPGTRSLRMPLSRAARRNGRALIEIRVESGPGSFRRVRLRG